MFPVSKEDRYFSCPVSASEDGQRQREAAFRKLDEARIRNAKDVRNAPGDCLCTFVTRADASVGPVLKAFLAALEDLGQWRWEQN